MFRLQRERNPRRPCPERRRRQAGGIWKYVGHLCFHLPIKMNHSHLNLFGQYFSRRVDGRFGQFGDPRQWRARDQLRPRAGRPVFPGLFRPSPSHRSHHRGIPITVLPFFQSKLPPFFSSYKMLTSPQTAVLIMDSFSFSRRWNSTAKLCEVRTAEHFARRANGPETKLFREFLICARCRGLHRCVTCFFLLSFYRLLTISSLRPIYSLPPHLTYLPPPPPTWNARVSINVLRKNDLWNIKIGQII